MPKIPVDRLLFRAGSRLKTVDATRARVRAAVSLLSGDEIHPLNELQLERWKKDRFLVCPHGHMDWDLWQFNAHKWGGPDALDFRGKTVFIVGGYDSSDNDSGERWAACRHEPYTSFWLPDDLLIEWT